MDKNYSMTLLELERRYESEEARAEYLAGLRLNRSGFVSCE
jgi:hypothetical protein